jgi:hypothetical protein
MLMSQLTSKFKKKSTKRGLQLYRRILDLSRTTRPQPNGQAFHWVRLRLTPGSFLPAYVLPNPVSADEPSTDDDSCHPISLWEPDNITEVLWQTWYFLESQKNCTSDLEVLRCHLQTELGKSRVEAAFEAYGNLEMIIKRHPALIMINEISAAIHPNFREVDDIDIEEDE